MPQGVLGHHSQYRHGVPRFRTVGAELSALENGESWLPASSIRSGSAQSSVLYIQKIFEIFFFITFLFLVSFNVLNRFSFNLIHICTEIELEPGRLSFV